MWPNMVPGHQQKSPVAEIFDSMDYGPAPESQNEANKWLDNHKRKFGHFVNGKWYEPEGREYYTSKAPMNHSVLAETIQGEFMFLSDTIIFVWKNSSNILPLFLF